MSIPVLIFKVCFYLVFSFLGICFCLMVFVSSMPYNTVTPSYEVKNVLHRLLPEGWSFFTKSPREDMADIYRIEGDQVTKITSCNAEPENLFGLSRKSRKVGMELSIVASAIADTSWQLIPKVEARYLADKQPASVNRPPNLHFLTPGSYLVSVYKPVPWAWADMQQNLDRQLKVALITF